MSRLKLAIYSKRKARGASIGLVVAAALLIIVAIIAGFKFMMYLGGSQELRNSVDAAALNVSKRAVENKVPCGVGSGYDDVADSTGNAGLTNINRVIGKAYLINANEEAMKASGNDTNGQGAGDAQQAMQQAQTILGNLYSVLNSKDAADVHFKQISQGKPAKLLGQEGAVTTDKNGEWAVAWVYRGEESNLQVDKMALPVNANPNLIQMKDSSYYMQGYNPMKANNEKFCFTTFHVGEAPHLISATAFQQAQTPVAEAQNPIPNAFKEAGQINGQLSLTATACAVANPMRKYYMAIPHSFVSISIENTAKWMVQGGLYAVTQYNYETGKVWQVKKYKIQKPGKGVEDGYATLGQEYQPPTLWHAIHDALPGDHTIVVNTLLQRIREFCPNYTAQNLQALLAATPLSPTNTLWYIYPTYKQPDLSDPTVVCVPATAGVPGWMSQPRSGPDGTAKPIMIEQAENGPNTCFSTIIGPYPTDKHFTSETGTINWTPGTGATQGLGNLNISRVTTVTFTALP